MLHAEVKFNKMSTEISPEPSGKWFSNKFLEQVLRTAEADDTISVSRREIKSASNKGDNYSGQIFRITIDVNRSGSTSEKRSLIVKSLPETVLGNTVSHGFPREVRMCRDVLPRMQQLLEKSAPGMQQEFGAKHYYSENKKPYILMLEDLSVKGFKLADRSVGLDLPHCELVMKSLARFHASSIPVYESNKELFDIYEKGFYFGTKAMEDFITNVSINQINTVARIVEKWPNGGRNLAQKLQLRQETLIEDFKKLYESDPNDYNVLAHGDLWITNLMFRYDDVTGVVQEVKFIDYQACAIASPVIDFQYFFYTSLKDDVREHHVEDLLKLYHNEFVRTLTLLGCKHKAISFESLKQEYERRSLLGFFYTVAFMPLMMTKPGIGHDLEAMSKDGDDASEGSVSKESIPVLKRLLPLFKQKGLF